MMKRFLFVVALALCNVFQFADSFDQNIVCYYDAINSHGFDGDNNNFTAASLQPALEHCTHLVYGYLDINSETFELEDIIFKTETEKDYLHDIQNQKKVKVLLSVGGDRDTVKSENYIRLLEATDAERETFIKSAVKFLRQYNMDGLDLALPLPRNDSSDEKIDEHRAQVTNLIKDLKAALNPDNYLLTLTVLPNVNATWYYNVPEIIDNLDFVNLCTFDFITPQRNPNEADYTASLYELTSGKRRLPQNTVHFHVRWWISQGCPTKKIHVGVSTYGRAWKMTKDSGSSGEPIVSHTDGPASETWVHKSTGFVGYRELCKHLIEDYETYDEATETTIAGNWPTLNEVSRTKRRFGRYAFLPADANGENGVWVSYSDSIVAATKATYVRYRDLGGIAFFDLTHDDYSGECYDTKYIVLQAIYDDLESKIWDI